MSRSIFAVVAAFALSLLPGPRVSGTPAEGGDHEVPAGRATAGLDDVRFVPNRGQWSPQVRYAVLGPTTGWLHDDGFSLRLERWSEQRGHEPAARRCAGAVVRTRFVGAATTGFEPSHDLATKNHFLIGPVERHVRDVPSFGVVTMREVLPGVDVRFRPLPDGDGASGGRGDAGHHDAGHHDAGAFEYDLLLDPGAELGAFAAELEGIESLRVDPAGRLCATFATPFGERELVQQPPIAWQVDADGRRRPVEVAFRLLGARRYGFVAADLDAELATVVDPGVVWGTYLGGGSADRIHDLAVQPAVSVYVAGWAGSADFPVTVGAFDTVGMADAFVARLADDGQSLQFATYLGGSGVEQVRGIVLASGGVPVVTGFTSSADFPVSAGAVQSTNRGGSIFLDVGDVFVTRLAADGSALVSSTFLGGVFDDVAEDLVLDAAGNAIVVGWTSSADFPVPPGGFQPQFAGIPAAQSDGFVVAVSADAQSLAYGTFLGGQASEQLLGIDRRSSGEIVVAGFSRSIDFPTTPFVPGTSSAGTIDAVVTRLLPAVTGVAWSTYLGGNDEDAAQTVAFADNGAVWVGGLTRSANFPATSSAPQNVFGGDVDGFVTRLDASGQQVQYSTFLGGPGPDAVRDIDVSSRGLMVVGEAGRQFPLTPDAAQTQFAEGATDGFVTQLTNNGVLSWSSYFGGVAQDALLAVDFDDGGLATCVGSSFSPDFPIAPAARQGQLLGVEDGVVLRIDVLSDLGPGLFIGPLSQEDVELVGPGDVELIRCDLQNLTARALEVDAVRVLVTGHGADGVSLGGLRVLREVDGAEPTLVGSIPSIAIGAENEVPLGGMSLLPLTTARIVVRASLPAAPGGASFELAAAIVAKDAWHVRAPGLAGGPSVSISGVGRATGPSFVVGAIAGDVDGSGSRDVVDVRGLVNTLGPVASPADVDGDGALTAVDLRATCDALIGRATVFGAPAQIARGDYLRVPVLLPDRVGAAGLARASLGGRSLTLGRAMPRELSLRVPADQATGLQELVVRFAGEVVFQSLVDVF